MKMHQIIGLVVLSSAVGLQAVSVKLHNMSSSPKSVAIAKELENNQVEFLKHHQQIKVKSGTTKGFHLLPAGNYLIVITPSDVKLTGIMNRSAIGKDSSGKQYPYKIEMITVDDKAETVMNDKTKAQSKDHMTFVFEGFLDR